jgi:hypothetical protein
MPCTWPLINYNQLNVPVKLNVPIAMIAPVNLNVSANISYLQLEIMLNDVDVDEMIVYYCTLKLRMLAMMK